MTHLRARSAALPLAPRSPQTAGKQIAFTSGRRANLDVFIMNANGTAVTRLTTSGADNQEPAWNR